MIEEDLAKYLLDSKLATSFSVQNRRVRGLTGEIFIEEAIQTTLLLPSGNVLPDIKLLVIGCNSIGTPILIGADVIVTNNLEPNLAKEALYMVSENDTYVKVNSDDAQEFKLKPVNEPKIVNDVHSIYIVSDSITLEPMSYTKVVVQLQGKETIPLQAVSVFEQTYMNKKVNYLIPPGIVYASPVMEIIVSNPTDSTIKIKSGKPFVHLTECTEKEKQKLKVYDKKICCDFAAAESSNRIAALSNVKPSTDSEQSKPVKWTRESLAESFKLTNNNLLDSSNKTRLTELLYKYSSTIAVSDHDVGTTSILQHHIDLKTKRPV